MATESSQMFLLLAVLVLGIFADPSESQELRCQCIQTQSDFISPKFIAKVQIIPEGAHCNRKEIIVTLKDGQLICLDPESEWVMNIIKKIV
ncbi:C-X-C motif chemokine 15-like isoform X2 [Bos indicus]|uniref:C-X-C motif chemokine n=1 Tax=Bos indicus TaxID=9915 RepID=A0A6P5BZN1_BOSIN|nr:PREDICTED: C-X-C motif chemokine 15-like isoform X2 [Bos indicus]